MTGYAPHPYRAYSLMKVEINRNNNVTNVRMSKYRGQEEIIRKSNLGVRERHPEKVRAKTWI